jgi:presenilin-like A22 family membrane protease
MSDKEPESKNETEQLVNKTGSISVMGYIVIFFAIICVLLKYRWNGLFTIIGVLSVIFAIFKYEDLTNSKK